VGKGLGLGLSVSYGIVQDFDGRIQADNRAEGGARLSITLPRLEYHAKPKVKAAHV
jgi:C4-dicarboxylate-specific signal transduction histidine kinase